MNSRSTSGGLTRRHWLAVGLAALAAGAGAGLGWRHLDTRRAAAAAEEQAVQAFWRADFEQADGRRLQMADFRGRPLLLNFWATWCPPCVKEMPLLDRFHRERGWQVIGLAIDQAAPVRDYLQRVPVEFPIALAGLDGTTLTRQLGNTGGQLPYTAVFDSQGRLAATHLGAVDEQMLATWVDRIA